MRSKDANRLGRYIIREYPIAVGGDSTPQAWLFVPREISFDFHTHFADNRRYTFDNRGIDMAQETIDFYSNSTFVTSSQYDVTFQFQNIIAKVVQTDEEGIKTIPRVEGTCHVKMSPQHAKAVAAILVKHIKDYEQKNHVVLPMTTDTQKIWDEYVNAGG